MCVGGAKDAQRRTNIRTRASCRVLKAVDEGGVDVLSHSCEEEGVHVCEVEQEA
jgi:hypothetical protein